MKLVVKPELFDVVVLTNLQGDIVSDLCAGLVGGLGFAPSANIGDHISIFEAVHGTAPDIMGKNIANPTALLLSGIGLLYHLGIMQKGAMIENALLYTLESGVRTGDFGDRSQPALSTTEFAKAIISNFGKLPAHNPKASLPNSFVVPTINKLDNNPMLETPPTEPRKIIGADLFVESNLQPTEVAEKMLAVIPDIFRLVTISNRGTQVWPKGSVFTNLVNQYRCRFEIKDETSPIGQHEILGLIQNAMEQFTVCSYEMLSQWGDNKGYTLAQGQ